MKKSAASLPPEAQPAWNAYRAMHDSRRRHSNLQSLLERKQRESGTAPSRVENARLKELEHREQQYVQAFNQAMARIREPAARQALLHRLQQSHGTGGRE